MKVRIPRGNPMGNMKDMAAKIQDMQANIEKTSKELEEKTYTFTAGGGVVKAEVKGSFKIVNLEIDKDIIGDDEQMLSETIIAAVNGAIEMAKNEKDKVMQDISSGMNLPNLPGLF